MNPIEVDAGYAAWRGRSSALDRFTHNGGWRGADTARVVIARGSASARIRAGTRDGCGTPTSTATGCTHSTTTGDEQLEELVVEHQPSGLGWLPDGDLLCVSMTDQQRPARSRRGRRRRSATSLPTAASGPTIW